MEFIFFTVKDFNKEGGGTIRMYGIINELAKQGNKVILFSNAQNLSAFHPAVKHVYIDYLFDARQKRILF